MSLSGSQVVVHRLESPTYRSNSSGFADQPSRKLAKGLKDFEHPDLGCLHAGLRLFALPELCDPFSGYAICLPRC